MVDGGKRGAVSEREDIWVSVTVDVANLAVESVVTYPALCKAEVDQIKAWVGERAVAIAISDGGSGRAKADNVQNTVAVEVDKLARGRILAAPAL